MIIYAGINAAFSGGALRGSGSLNKPFIKRYFVLIVFIRIPCTLHIILKHAGIDSRRWTTLCAYVIGVSKL